MIMDKLKLDTYCGLYCGLCGERGRIPRQAEALQKSISEDGYPTLIANGRRMKEIGPDAWIREQEERAKTGFAYADIRCYPYNVPGE